MFKQAAFVTAMMAFSALATPMLGNSLKKRAEPSQVNNLPSNNQDCNGNAYSPDDIATTIKWAWDAVDTNTQYREPNSRREVSTQLTFIRRMDWRKEADEKRQVSPPLHTDTDGHAMVRLQPGRLRDRPQ